MLEFLIGLVVVVLVMALDFALTYGLFYVICWAFNLTTYFNIKYVIGVWVIMIILRSIFKSRKD